MTHSRWYDEITSYSSWLRAGNRSAGTVGLRRSHVRRLQRWLKTTAPGSAAARDPWQVSEEHLVAWMASRAWRPETRRAARASIRGFYAWAVATGRLQRSPALVLPSVLVPRALPRPIPDDAAAAALAAADERGRTKIALACAGLRSCEVCLVNADDLVGDGDVVELWVVGKGGHTRYVPLVDLAVVAAVRAAAGNPGGWVFPGRVGGHLSPHYASKLLSRLLPGSWTGHTLRHRAGTKAYQGTRDIRAVHELLGHANIRETQKYTLVGSAQLRAVAEAAAAGLL